AGQLARGVTRRLHVEEQEPDVAVVLRLRVVDLRALPEPRLPGRPRIGGEDERCHERGEDERRPHDGVISAAGPTMPVRRGRTSRMFSCAQYAMSSSRPGGP